MNVNTNYNFYCGTSRGFLASTTWKIGESNLTKPHYNTENKGDEISSFEYGRHINEIVLGTVKGNLRLYNVIDQNYYPEELINTEQPSDIVGSTVIQDNIVFGRKNGIVTNWNPTSNTTDKFAISVGKDADIRTFQRNDYRPSLFAVAGHRYEYALWDLEQKRVVFQAKSLPADQLYQLPQTTFANDLCVLNFGGGHVCAIVTAEGVTMLYDDRAQRRPVFILKKECKGGAQTSFTCVKPAKGLDYLLTAGTTRGAIHLLDIRGKNGYTGAITGYNGAVTSIAPMNLGTDSAIASTSLDGNLRVHCVTTKKLLYKMYLKVGLKGVLTQTVVLESPELPHEQTADSCDLDNIFASMETIADKHRNDAQNIVDNQNQQRQKKSKAITMVKSKSRLLVENGEDIKPTELQRLWKEDVTMLINTDPFKEQQLNKTQDGIEAHVNNNIASDDENNESIKNRKLKRKNDAINLELGNQNMNESLGSKIKSSKRDIVYVAKDDKTVETKKHKKKSKRFKSEVV